MKMPIIVKKRQHGYVLYTLVGILMLTISLLFLFFPFIPKVANALPFEMQMGYMILGGVCTMFFAFATTSFLFGAIAPSNALKITQNGLYDYTVAGKGVGFIPCGAIVSLKLFGDRKNTFLGIKLDSDFTNSLSADKSVKKELTENYLSGLPNVIIKQNDIRMPINELMDILLELYADDNRSVDNGKEQAVTEISIPNEALLINDVDELTPKEEQLPNTAVDYTPILVKREKTEKPKIKTVDELLAELNILTPTSPQGEKPGLDDEALRVELDHTSQSENEEESD